MLCQLQGRHWSAMWACSVSPGSRACWQMRPTCKMFLTTSTTSASADEMVCTQQPCLRPGCHPHAVSSSDIVVACHPLTPWLHITTYLGLSRTPPYYPQTRMGSPWVPSSQGTIILASTMNTLLPISPAWAHYMSVNTNEWDRKHKQTGERTWLHGTENTNEWDREHDCEQERDPISVTMYPSCWTLMGLWCNLCPLHLPLHHIIHNCHSTTGMPPLWIALSWPRGTGSACQMWEILEGSMSVSETAGNTRSVWGRVEIPPVNQKEQERSHQPKHSSLDERQRATSLMLPLHPSHAQVLPYPLCLNFNHKLSPMLPGGILWSVW